ncbi:hypothetical protein EIP86_002510 [Pleurotus ostreatoroseus]|nr:hypothetical protein EIP86_002510 [Pleurotus ostreatoroseus]
MSEELSQLRNILVNAIDSILEVCSARGIDFPSLDKPADASEYAKDGVRNDPKVADAISLGVAAAAQLIATLQPPAMTLYSSAARFNLPACLGAAERLNVPEILRNAGTKGMHIDDIVKANGADPQKLGRVLRYLATNHIFRETAPNVFANNMVSSLLDTGKDYQEIENDPLSKFDNTDGLTAWISFIADDCMKSGAYLSQTLTDPVTAHSKDPNETSIQKAFRFEGTRWEFLERPENLFMFRRYGAAMSGAARLQPPWAVLTKHLSGYDWALIPEGSVFADVGSGIGNFSLEIAKIRPDFTFILEDRPPVMEKAKIPNLPARPDVFFMRTILHDWSDPFARKILINLRHAAKPETKLLIIDTLIEYACNHDGDTSEQNKQNIPGYEPQVAPKPLLSNMGYSSIASYDLDMVVSRDERVYETTERLTTTVII